MNNIIKFALVFVFIIAVLCGCADDSSATDVITDIPEGPWDQNLEEHWKTDANGEIVYSGEHVNLDDWVCDICGCEIIDWGDGSFDINSYDGYGNITKSTSYSNGEIIFEAVNEYFYNDYGNILFSTRFENGVLTEECTYSVDTEGYSVLQETKTYFEDGTYTESSYNENGDIREVRTYFDDGSLYFESFYEYAVSSDGFSYCVKISETNHSENRKYYYTYNEMDDCIHFELCDEKDMTISSESYEYEYNDEGWTTYKSTKINGLPSEEIYFGIFDDGEGSRWTYYEKRILYNEDGSYTVFEYNENDELLTETSFDADGNEI